MIYATLGEFYKHFEGSQVGPEDAWKVYLGAKKAALKMQVFGRHVKVGKRIMEVTVHHKRENATPRGITNEEMNNFKHSASAKANSLVGGSILALPQEGWSFGINDAWVCGGVHSGQEFHCASDPGANDNVFDAKHMVTVTGRELIGLAIAGYQRARGVSPKFGAVYVSTNKDYGLLDLVSYKKQMDAFDNDQEKVRDFLLKHNMIN